MTNFGAIALVLLLVLPTDLSAPSACIDKYVVLCCLFVLRINGVSCCVTGFSSPVHGVRVVGNQLVNYKGQVIRLLGVNRSGMEFSCVNSNA